jgi:hypothetical protein
MTGTPVQITFRGLAPSEALEAEIRERARWLEQFHGTILGCRALLEVPHRRRHSGRPLHIRLELSVPGRLLTVAHDTEITRARYAGAAIHEAFDKMRRCLQDFAREQRHDVKTHAAPAM